MNSVRIRIFFRLFLAATLCMCNGCGSGYAADRTRVEILTSIGRIVIALEEDKAPITAANFLRYVDASFYDGTIFHRVIPNFMIQGGGMTTELVEKETWDPIPNESRNHLHNERGTIAMARTGDPDSATAQFYINVRNNLRLDFDYVTRKPGYTVFGQVIEGMDVVDAIALVDTTTIADIQDIPVEPVVIESVKRLE